MGFELGRMLLNIGFRVVSGFIPGGSVVQLTIEEFGPAFCEAAWNLLKGGSDAERRAAVEQLGQLDAEEVRALAEQSLAGLPNLAPELRAQAVDYLAALPMSARGALARTPSSGADLLRFLPLRPPMFRAGQRLAGHDWRLERLLGQGGFGEVWLATNPRRPRQAPAALKFCLDARMRQGLERETELLDRIEAARRHPGVVQLLGTALSAEPPFLVYEYVEGGDLTRWLALRQEAGAARPEPSRVAELLLQIADALGFAHGLGLVHCDLKPSNVLLDPAGSAKLSDFGIGRLVAEAEAGGLRTAPTLARSSVLHGACTPMYADRAQRRGEAVDARADVYAVGVMAYQLLLGDITLDLSPYFREELEAAGVPASLREVVAGCLALPERRYRDGAALRAALEPRASAPAPKQASAQAPLVLRTPRRTYTLAGRVATGPIAELFRASVMDRGREADVLLKLVRSADDNEFLENEARILRHLREDPRGSGFAAYFPEPLDSFLVRDPGTGRPRQALALAPYEERPTLERILRAYPAGVDVRDMAWMVKRVLGLAAVAHAAGVVHGALIPPFIGFDLENHNPFFPDWPFAGLASEKRPIRALVPGYEAYYPPEVLAKAAPTPATDLFMIGKCMIRLLGGSVEAGEPPDVTPAPIRRLLKACTIPEPALRLDDAWQLHQEFDAQFERLFGPKKFRKFRLP